MPVVRTLSDTDFAVPNQYYAPAPVVAATGGSVRPLQPQVPLRLPVSNWRRVNGSTDEDEDEDNGNGHYGYDVIGNTGASQDFY